MNCSMNHYLTNSAMLSVEQMYQIAFHSLHIHNHNSLGGTMIRLQAG
jgi:hypothetical protein